MENLPLSTYFIFSLTVLISVLFFYKATGSSKLYLIMMISWLALQSFMSISGFYLITYSLPPRFSLLVIPPAILIILLFILPKGRDIMDHLKIQNLILFHMIRIPVEIILFLLFVNEGVPQLMTFEGRNFDILSGLTAPFIYYLYFKKRILPKSLLLLWNFICLGLLVNIVLHAIYSMPTPFQKFAFDQPNVALLHFPFVFLPAILVPMVLFAHLATIRLLILSTSKKT